MRRWRSITAACAEFLSVEENERIINDLCGWGCREQRLAVWDALEVTERVPGGFGWRRRKARTFSEAFAACAGPAGDRTWATFNLTALRELAPEFAGLQLPPSAYEEQATAAAAEWSRGILDLDGWADAAQHAWYADGGGQDEEMAEARWAAEWDIEHQVTEDMIEAEGWAEWAAPPALPAYAWR